MPQRLCCSYDTSGDIVHIPEGAQVTTREPQYEPRVIALLALYYAIWTTALFSSPYRNALNGPAMLAFTIAYPLLFLPRQLCRPRPSWAQHLIVFWSVLVYREVTDWYKTSAAAPTLLSAMLSLLHHARRMSSIFLRNMPIVLKVNCVFLILIGLYCMFRPLEQPILRQPEYNDKTHSSHGLGTRKHTTLMSNSSTPYGSRPSAKSYEDEPSRDRPHTTAEAYGAPCYDFTTPDFLFIWLGIIQALVWIECDYIVPVMQGNVLASIVTGCAVLYVAVMAHDMDLCVRFGLGYMGIWTGILGLWMREWLWDKCVVL